MDISPDIIDVSEVLERVDGDKELLSELVELFRRRRAYLFYDGCI